MRVNWKSAVAFTALLAGLYTAWPLWAGWQLRQAVRTRNTVALEARVNWPLLRANLKPRLSGAIAESAAQSGAIGGAVKRALGAVVAGPAVDAFVTPANLGRILAGRAFVVEKFPGAGKPTEGVRSVPGDTASEEIDDPVPPRRLRWAFFESPTRFRVESVHPRLAPSRVAAILVLDGFSWKLADVEIVKR